MIRPESRGFRAGCQAVTAPLGGSVWHGEEAVKAWGPQGAFLTAPEGLGPRMVCSKVALQDLALPVSQISPVPMPSGRGSSPVDGARLTHISVPPYV